MAQYIDKSAVVAEIERRTDELYDLLPYTIKVEDCSITTSEACNMGKYTALVLFRKFIDTLEVKEVKEPASTSYVVTRCEEHSDYVEKVFFDEDKAQEYCDQFNGNENEYARHITRVEITL